jgi:phage minor structural protein
MAQANLYVLDYQKVTVGVLSNRMPFSLPFYEDLQERSLDDFTDILTFKVPANHKDSGIINADNYILYPDKEGSLKLYKIQELTEIHEGGQLYKGVYAELSAQDDLIKDVVRPLSFTSATLEDVIKSILNGSDWSVGYTEDFGTQDYIISDYPTKLQALIDAFKAYGAELDFEYVTTGTTVIGQKVNAFSMIGQETGKTFMIGKDVVGVERSEDRSKLVTAMIGIGKDINGVPLTFSVETEAQLGVQLGGFPEGFEKPDGVDYVGNKDARNSYSKNGSHIMGVYKDTEAQSSYELFRNTLEALKKYSKPLMTYRATVALLEKLAGYAHESVSLGDTVMVQDKELSPELYVKARIRKLSRSITNPQEDAVELGDYIAVIPPVNQQLAQMQSKIRNNETTWNEASKIPQIEEDLANKANSEDVFSMSSQRLKVRYVRSWTNGNSVDADNHPVELKVFKQGVNIAKGILPTSSNATATDLAYLTDDIVDYNRYVSLGSGLQYVEIDLGSIVEDVEYIHTWNYYSDGRIYNQHQVDVSEDGINWVRLFNSDKHGTHAESADGLIVPVNSSAIIRRQEKEQAQTVVDVEELQTFKQSTEAVLPQKVDLTTYNSKVTAMESDIASKAGLEYVNGELVSKADKADTYTKTETDNALNSKVSTTTYTTDHNGVVSRLDSAESRITQTETDIQSKVSTSTYNALEGRVSTAESNITQNATTISTKITADEAKAIAEAENAINFRYVRYIGSGNNVNTGDHLVEIGVYDTDNVNVALNKTVTSGQADATNLLYMTDGVIDSGQYAFLGYGDGNSQWAMIDLGQVYTNVKYINVWHYWWDATRAYNFDMQVSEDGVNWISVYDTYRDGTYLVTSAGFAIFVNQQVALYSMQSAITQTADAISTKAEASVVGSMEERLTTAEEKITSDSIVNTVTSSTEYTDALGAKADASALASKAEVTDLDAVKKDLTDNYVTSTRLEQDLSGFEFKVSKGGGVNLLKNSVGFADTDFWGDYSTEKVKTVANESLDALGFGSGFHFVNDAFNKGITQTVYVEVGNPVTLSWYLNKFTAGNRFWVQIQEGGVTKLEIEDNTAVVTNGYEANYLTYTPTTNQITVRFIAYANIEAIVTGIMLNVGDLPLQWSMAQGEVYNTNVTIDAKGVKVASTEYDGYTAITPEEFAGYYKVNGVEEKVFTLNKDTTVIAKAEIQKEINMSPIKVVPINTATLKGWAFVAES